MSEVIEHFDFIELGQAIMKAREQQRIMLSITLGSPDYSYISQIK